MAQSQIVKPAPQNNSNSGKRQHVATLHSSDSQEGSRVAISSDQSLNNYEAYRRGDRFYVKIPAADVPRAEAVRGRGFADVTAQRSGDSTLLSFRLQPGATAHVEQRANKLDVVVTVPGGSSSVASNRSRETTRSNPLDPSRNSTLTNRNSAPTNSNRNDARTNSLSPLQSNSNRKPASAATPVPKATPTPAATPAAKGSPTPQPVASASPLKGPIAKTSPTASPVTTTTQSQPDWWSRMKERGHYWLLLAQLNPIPVAVGAAILILIIGLLLVQRRRAKSTKRVKPSAIETRKPSAESTSEAPAATIVEPPAPAAVEIPLAAVAAVPFAAQEIASEHPAPLPVVPIPPVTPVVDDVRRERVNQVADEAKKLFDGADYDKAIIGSEDRDTRRLVGAELLSALVGRNPARRERAREAFMKHGYFDDATRDLRVAESDNERAAAARRLSFVHDREAIPHLIGALGDPAPDVRRASVEALMDLRDPSAIGPLNSLLQTENDRKVPRPLIKHAIEACATSTPEAAPSLPLLKAFLIRTPSQSKMNAR